MKKYYLLLLFLGYSWATNAQFTLSGEIRPRLEFRNGFKKLHTENTDPAFFVEQRSRLNLDFKKEKLAFRLSLQDVRLWGETSQVYKSDASLFNVFEAWGQYSINDQVSIRVGRQALSYDNERFLGALDWAQQSRSHDLALFLYERNKTKFHAGFAFNQEDVNNPAEPSRLANNVYALGGNYKTMQYAWLHHVSGASAFSFLFLNNGVQSITASDTTVHFSQTAGLYTTDSVGRFALFTGEAYYQFGKNPVGKELNAYLLAASLSFKLGKIPLTVGADFLSGTSSASTKDHSFNPLYGTNHKFYGFMDYFFVGNPHGNVGLTDIYLQTKTPLHPKGALLTQIHSFSSATSLKDSDGSVFSKSLGTEIDLVYNLQLAPEVNFKLGYSQMFATNTMEAVKGGDKSELTNWAWAMLSFTPVFLKN